MKNPFTGKSVPKAVQDELTARSGALGTIWTAQRFPWISVISMCEECKNWELSNGGSKSNTDRRYTDGYKRPNPTITQLQVRKQGELGTTRKATINITAYNDLQLLELQQCFFIPGMSVRVQWGWSLSATGTKGVSIYKNRDVSDSIAFCIMNKTAGEYPQYEGLQGLVTTFNYTLTQDGYWDCSIDIISAADALLETKTSYQCCDCPAESKEDEVDEKQATVSEKKSLLYSQLRLISFAQDLSTFFENIKKQETQLKSSMSDFEKVAKPPTIMRLAYEGLDRTAAGTTKSGFMAMINGMFNYSTTETYMTWDTLEVMVNRYCFPGKGNDHIPSIGRINSTDIKLKAPPYIESTDPRVCLLPGSVFFEKIVTADEIITLDEDFLELAKLKPLFATQPAVNNGSNGSFVYLNRMLVNCIFLMSELDAVEQSNGNLGTFLYNVLRKISDVCGGIWDFDIVSSTEGCEEPATAVPTLTIVERKDTENATPYLVPSMPSSTVVRELKLDLKMTEAMKSQALYSNASGDASNKCSKNTTCGSAVFRPFQLAKVKTGGGDAGLTNMAYPAAEDTQAPPCDCETSGTGAPLKKSFKEYMDEMLDVVNDTTTTAANNALIDAVSKDIGTDDSYLCGGIILPFNFEFTVDGIGGFKFGQIVSSTRIPASLRENYVWQVTAVEHTMNIQDWTTTVKTVARYNPKKTIAKPIKDKLTIPEELNQEAAGYSSTRDNTRNDVRQDINPYINAINQGKVTIPGSSPVDFGPAADPNP